MKVQWDVSTDVLGDVQVHVLALVLEDANLHVLAHVRIPVQVVGMSVRGHARIVALVRADIRVASRF